ncbi:L-ribulokinase [Abditibacterium utsteinense]|uniref:L-ribulokinase n=1 Tax=Abditibacterium utsteinense TaxID=1960156 RepID=A0A2S8SRX5_9BACT|nr:ribulokinase [Abditibacterium utsteinense]PQV63550.1 L-ribulokinase [Abditibacterium utsteinense]
MNSEYVLGLDYGTNSVRALLVDAQNGAEVAVATWNYARGEAGILLARDPNLARQHPADYLDGARETIGLALQIAQKIEGFAASQVIGIGIDTTGSTPIPLDENGIPLAFDARFDGNLNALAWLWKDHTSWSEAAEITELARQIRPQYLAKCGGIYSSEWYFSKILHCLRVDEAVFDAAYSWVECADWIPAMLSGTQNPQKITLGVCAAGHKAMWNARWGGFPDAEFLGALHPKLAPMRARMSERIEPVGQIVGGLSEEWAQKTGLHAGIPLAVGAFDAHLGGVGAGIAPGTLVKTLGTSTCDLMVVSGSESLADIPGLCGIVEGSILPGFYGLEAGQSAVGDIFNWFVDGLKTGTHEELTLAAGNLKAGESGLLALDWNNGNRTVLVDGRLTGLLLGQTLHTSPGEIYRALIEATAFGALTIINRLEEYGVKVERVVNCGGIAEKNATLMQIYADIIGRPMQVSRSSQTCALGAAISAAVAAGRYPSFESAQAAMTELKAVIYTPNPGAHAVYRQLFALYSQLHEAFGTPNGSGNLFNVMKTLLDIREKARA